MEDDPLNLPPLVSAAAEEACARLLDTLTTKESIYFAGAALALAFAAGQCSGRAAPRTSDEAPDPKSLVPQP